MHYFTHVGYGIYPIDDEPMTINQLTHYPTFGYTKVTGLWCPKCREHNFFHWLYSETDWCDACAYRRRKIEEPIYI